MTRVFVAAIAALWPATVIAADQPSVGPAANWVQQAPSPATTSPADAAAERMLLLDQQAHFGDEGVSVYTESVTRLQTPQGVTAAGSVALSWRPDVDQMTIHRLRILRGSEVIDVLAKQKFSVLRRESNMEAAEVDGVLTAALQPEDLRVGDRLDLAWTTTTKDPVLAGHAEASLGPPNVRIDDFRMRVVADRGVDVHLRGTEAFAKAKLVDRGEGVREFAIALKDLAPLQIPDDAPVRFRQGRQLELSEFGSWSEVSALMAPLYAKAETLVPDSPLRLEAAKIRASAKNPKEQAAAALHLVQDQLRYLALTMNDGGLAPASADLTWSRRFGDCKAKTVLLMALLNELGIAAQPALVNTEAGDGMDARQPSVQAFDHILVRAIIAGRTYWLDGARNGDIDLDRIQTPAFSWALPVQDRGGALVRLDLQPLSAPDTLQSLTLDASAGLEVPAPAHAEVVLRGDAAATLNTDLGNLGADQNETGLKAYWTKIYPFIQPKVVSARYDAVTGEERLVMEGSAAMKWVTLGTQARSYEADGYQLGWKPNWKREPPYADVPVAVEFPDFSEVRETIRLPRAGAGFTINGTDVDTQIGVWSLKRTSAIKDGVFTMVATSRTLSPELAAKDIPATTQALTDLADNAIHVHAPPNFRPTDQDLAELGRQTPKDADGYIERGLIFIRNDKYQEAATDFRRAFALNGQSTIALADLGLAEAHLGQFAQARADLDKASSLSGHQDLVFQGYGVLAMQRQAYAEAVTAFSRAVEVRPSDLFSLQQRASAYYHLRKTDQVLADTDTLLRAGQDNMTLRGTRAAVFAARGENDRALAEADAVLTNQPNSAWAHEFRAVVLVQLGRRGDAQVEFDKFVALMPTAEAYLTRAKLRVSSDLAGRLADADAALKLEPDNREALQVRAYAHSRMGAHDQALADLNKALSTAPDNTLLRLARAQVYVRAGRLKDATDEFGWVRSKAGGDAETLNNLCWEQATVRASLPAALADCDASLKVRPDSARVLDSKALVLLELGRYPEAVAAYNQALAIDPAQAVSGFGRGLAKLKEGKTVEGQADMAEARKFVSELDDLYKSFGVSP